MLLPETRVQFTVGLSNGENLIEGEGILSRKEGELSPWNKLIHYLQENELSIKSLSLVCKTDIGNRHYNLPNEKRKFRGEIPIGYNCFRKGAMDGGSGSSNLEFYTCAEAIYPEFKVQLYVSELDPDKCHVNIVKEK